MNKKLVHVQLFYNIMGPFLGNPISVACINLGNVQRLKMEIHAYNQKINESGDKCSINQSWRAKSGCESTIIPEDCLTGDLGD